jgi:uncharacterized repeat protein (TIGR01451 family)/fimbrial isopeptide formation D2 family protein
MRLSLTTRTRAVAIAVVSALIGGLLVVTAAVPATADGGLQLTAESSPSVLAGNIANVTLTASNDSGSDEYNASFRYVLPAGVTYSAGTTTPTDAGEPQVIANTDAQGVVTQTLIWSNVSDLSAADSTSISFSVTADATAYPVGASFTAQAGVYTSGDPRIVPKFTAAGVPVPDTTTPVYSQTATATTSKVSALSVTKSEPSPETELMRGVHDHPTVYTLNVSNTKEAVTDQVFVDDYLPAGLEFLGCGGIDNTGGGRVEYPGANRLTATTADTSGDCLAPDLVETVQNPTGYPAGVYTHVQWSLATLGPLVTTTIKYVAAVPERENTMTFTGGTPATTGAQAADLDNNNGPSTRQVNGAATWTNDVVASGQYTGAVANASDRTTTATDSATIKASDLSIVKSVATDGFSAGNLNTYSLLVRSSEYVSDHDMTITDVVDDGLCPAFPASITATGDPLPADCNPSLVPTLDHDATGGSITAVAYDASTGKFTITMTPGTDPLPRSSSETISYQVLMRDTFSDGSPTSAGDDFSNHVGIAGTSTSQPGLVETGDQPVTDDSGTTISTDTTTIDKEILPRTNVSSAADCEAAGSGAYQQTTPSTDFQLGDNVCFQLTVNFPTSTETRNARVADLVPVGTSYEGWAYGTQSTVPSADVALASSTRATQASWNVGHTVPGNSGIYVDKGQSLTLYVLATITGQGSSTATPDLVDNLMKYRQTNSAGKAISLRDDVGYDVAGSPTVALGKAIVSRNGAAITPTSSTTTAEGETLGYALTVSNTGTAASGTNVAVNGVVVWDRLPAGVTCAAVTTPIPNAGTCSDTAPAGAADTTRSYLAWTIPTIAAGASTQLTYSVTTPSGTSVSDALTNDSSVTRFASNTTAGTAQTYRTANSLDTSTPATTDGTAPQANAAATATLPDASVVKTGGAVATPETNVSGATGVQGQAAAYDYAVTVPAGTTVFNATLTDADLTSGALPLDASGAVYTVTTPDGVVHAAGNAITYAGASFTLSGAAAGAGNAGTLTFPAAFDNTGTSPVTFTVHATGLVIRPGAPLAAITNTSRFSSTSTSSPTSTTLPDRTGAATVQVVAPAPSLVKSSSSGTVTANGRVTFTLVASNASAVQARDALVVDCLPAGLTLDAVQPPLPTGVTSAAVTSSDLPSGFTCAAGTLVGYTFATLTQGQNVSIPLLADVDPNAGGGATYTNTATIVTSSLGDGGRNAATEGVQSANSNAVRETVQGGTIAKSVSVAGGATAASGTGRAGDPATYTVTATLPANVNFYGAAVFDTLPAGMTIADGSGITCTPSDPSITCTPGNAGTQNTTGGTVVFVNLGDVRSSATARTVTLTIPVTVPLTSTKGQVFNNTAKLGWSTAAGTQPTTPSSTFSTTKTSAVVPVTAQRPDLSITKTTSQPNPKPGDTFTYTLSVRNSSAANTSTAYGASITDCIPTGVVVVDPGTGVVGPATTNPTCDSTITWTGVAPIAAGATAQVTYTARLADSTTLGAGALVNTASVPSYRSLPTGGQTYAAVSTTAAVTPSFPNMTITKTHQTGPAYVGTPYTWTVTFTNTGSAGSTIDATDVLPPNWTYDAGSATITRGGTTTATADPTITGTGTQTLEWANLGALPTGTVTLTYTATPTTAATVSPGIGSTVNHTNSVSGTVTDATGATGSGSGPYSANTSTNPVTSVAHIDAADLSVVKTGVATQPVAGLAGPQDAWTITVSNAAGSDQAVGPFTVTDTPGALPAGAVISGATGSGWSCILPPNGTSAFTCTTSAGTTLDAGAGLPPITVQVTLPSNVPAGTALPNAAAVTSRTADPNTANNTGSGSVTTAATADLAITKTGPGTAQAGTNVSWQLQVENLGPSDAAGPVTVHDAVPSDVTVTAVDGGTDWSCGTPSNTIDCTIAGGVAANATVSTITVTGTLDSAATGTLTNTATVSSPTADPVTANNSATATSTTGTGTTLSVTKTLRGSFTPGTDATYRVTVQNAGTADATAVVVRDPLPTGLTYGSFASVTGSWSRDTSATDPTFDLAGSLRPNATAVIDLTVHVASDVRGDVVNTAYAAATNAAEQNGRWTNSSTPLTTLSATKSHSVASVVAGGTFDWTIDVTNQGPSDLVTADTSTVTDTLPVGVTYVGSSGDGVGPANGWSTTGPHASGVITWTSTSPAVVGASLPPITLRVAVGHDYTGIDVANTAIADSTNAVQSVTTNTDVVPVTHTADVTITKTLDSSPVVAGTDAHFTVTVTNAGPSDARSVAVRDLVPTGMTVTAIDSADAGWDCAVATADCVRTVLAPGTSTITVTAHVDSSVTTTLTNAASINWSDDSAHVLTSSVAVPVTATADVFVRKTAVEADGSASTTVAAGTVQRWEMVVHNGGPSDAVGPITVTDVLPTGLAYSGLATDTTIAGANVGWTCAEANGTVTCTSDDTVVAGHDAPAPLVIATTVDAGQPAGPIVNAATVITSTPPTTAGTPSSPGTVDVAPLANLTIGLTHAGSGVIGQAVPFTAVVRNDGPSEAQDVTTTMTLPKGLTFRDTDGTDPAWTAGTPVVNADGTTTIVFTLTGPLAPDAAAPPIVVGALVGPEGYPSATVTAAVATSTPETTVADNTGTDGLTVAPLSQIGVTKTHTMALERNHTVAYTITVSNTGLTADPGPVTVTDPLPSGLSFVSVDDAGAATCTTGSTVTCTLDAPLAVGASVALVLTVRVAGNAPDRIVNQAFATTPSLQVTPLPSGGAEASDPGAVQPDPDAVTNPNPLAPGGALAFTGSTGTNAALLFAILAMFAGAGILVWRRRRGRRS